MKKTKKYKRKQKGGSTTTGLTIMGLPIEKSTPGLFDGRTCYRIGPIKWCSRKKNKTTNI